MVRDGNSVDDIPWVSQVVGPLANLNNNECGLACVLSLARWFNRGYDTNVAAMSDKYDKEDDGTLAETLVLALKEFGLTGKIDDSKYPHILLGWYKKLPFANRLKNPAKDFRHWIIRKSDTVYMDPYGDNIDYANRVAPKALLDGFRIRSVGIVERPGVTNMPRVGKVTSDSTHLNVRSMPTTVNNVPVAMIEDGATVFIDKETKDNKNRPWYLCSMPVQNVHKYSEPDSSYLQQLGWCAGWLIKVLGAPDPPPSPAASKLTNKKMGLHFRGDVEAAREAAALGCQAFTIMDNYSVARELAENTDNVVIHRKYISNWRPSGAELASWIENCGGKVWHTLLNECDGECYGTVEELRRRADVELEAAKRLLDRGERVLILNSSVGTPNILDPYIRETLMRTYGEFYNKDTSGKVGINMHLYSPYKGHMQGQVRREASNSHTKDGIIYEQAGRNPNNYATKLAQLEEFVSYSSTGKGVDIADDRIWYEWRWKWLYQELGFRIDRGAGVFCDEWGIDHSGIGGMAQLGMSQEEILDWNKHCLMTQSAPILINGVEYPSPVRAGTIFQSSRAEGWGGYYVSHKTMAPMWQ